MKQNNNMEAIRETSRLLSELDLAIDESSVMREIISKYEYIRNIENITGPSRLTRIMRKEIQLMEKRLRLARSRPYRQDIAVSLV